VFIDDGSEDDTLSQLKELHSSKSDKIKVARFSRNFGKEAAIFCGLKYASGEYITMIDVDLQQNPEIVMKKVEILEKNKEIDCVCAYQEIRKESRFKTLCKKTFYSLINRFSETEFVQGASDFRTFRRKIALAVLNVDEYHRFSKGIFSWVGFNTHYISYKVENREYGDSKWSGFKLFKYAIEGIISFTTVPLKVATATGLFSAFTALLYSIFVFFQKVFYSIEIPGYATLVILILLLGGLQLFSIGIVGEYIARIYIQTKKRPIYITSELIEYE